MNECVVQGYVKLSKYNEGTLVLMRYGTEGVYKITQKFAIFFKVFAGKKNNKAFALKYKMPDLS